MNLPISNFLRRKGHIANAIIVKPTSIPAEAAELISNALSFEAEERLEESVAAYRWLHLKMLISVTLYN